MEPGAAASQRGQEARAQGTSSQQPAISGLCVWPQKDRGVKRLPGEPARSVQLSGVWDFAMGNSFRLCGLF